jgi:hypothetical protein
MTLAAISTAGFVAPAPVEARSLGARPELKWIAIDDLYVDMAYQREVLGQGRKNVQAIVHEFDWTYFGPVIVAPAGEFYAVVDGQHRVTAAKVVGIKEIPCCVVFADATKQAKAFGKLNGQTTQIHPLQLFAAAIAAGDEAALELQALCAQAGVKILRNPRSQKRMKLGETCSITTLRDCLRRHGPETLLRALLVIMSRGGQSRGQLSSTLIGGLCAALEPMAGVARAVALSRLGDVNLPACEQAARRQHLLDGGSLRELLAAAITRRLKESA